jgi:hypothetical protein
MRTAVIVYDDLDGSEGASRVTFAYGGTGYEIDLGDTHRTELEHALARFIAAARRTGRVTASTDRSPYARPVGQGRDLAAIRAWARDHGFEVSDHGRVPTRPNRPTTQHTDP